MRGRPACGAVRRRRACAADFPGNAAIAAIAELGEVAVETESDRVVAPPLLLSVPSAAAPPARMAASMTPVSDSTFASSPDVAETAPPPVDGNFTIGTNEHLAATPIDLGVGSYWKSVAGSASSGAAAASPRADHPGPNATSVEQVFRQERDARDRDLGLGAGGPLVTAAHRALGIDGAPDVGSATIDFDCDAEGKVVLARVVPPAAAQWENVRREMLRLMADRSVHVASGSHGTRVRCPSSPSVFRRRDERSPPWPPAPFPNGS